MTSLAYIHDCHSCYDERSIVQKKNLWWCGGVWCFCGGVFVVVWWLCFCGGVLGFCGCVFVVVFCGGVFAVVFCGGVLWWCFGGVFVVVFW